MPPSDIDAQVLRIGAALKDRVDELAHQIASAIKADVAFYRETKVITADELIRSSADNTRFIFSALPAGQSFDTSPAVDTGSLRAAVGVPLPAVMAAFRVAAHHIWDVMIEIARTDPQISSEALLRATKRVWQAQDAYTDAMTSAYREQALQQALDAEAERAAMTEALFDGHVFDDRTVWEIAQLLGIPHRGPYIVVAAEAPIVGKQALPTISAQLRSVNIYSAWRLLPDVEIGIAHLPTQSSRAALLGLLRRTATTAVGVSAPFDDLSDTAQALRYARIALTAREREGDNVTVFDDSVLGVAAVSTPEITQKLATIVLGAFDQLGNDDRDVLFDTFRTWIHNRGSVQQTAAEMFCHPNTLRHRLHRIQELSGRSITVPHELAELCLAFEIHQRLR
ncbi:MAG: helix-turn-helix domain-containing protein [Mycobacterium sp.]|uniref:helix-turn-helix domain-containing protein n=1 Tax=Mycobacterium sp. TaxID=1785 RepID=UPI003C76C345